MAKEKATTALDTNIDIEPYKKEIVSIEEVAGKIKVKDAESNTTAVELISKVEAQLKKIKGVKDILTKPLKDHVKLIGRMFEPLEDTLSTISQSLRGKTRDYFMEQERIAEEKRRKEMEAFNKKAEKAIEKGKEVPDFVSKVAEPVQKVVSTSGTLSMQKFTNFKIVNPALVPRDYLVIDESLIRKAITNGITAIDGVELFEDVRTINRR